MSGEGGGLSPQEMRLMLEEDDLTDLRDKFAGLAMASIILARPVSQPEYVAQDAYKYADAMLKAREKHD